MLLIDQCKEYVCTDVLWEARTPPVTVLGTVFREAPYGQGCTFGHLTCF